MYQNKKKIMRMLMIILTVIILSACGATVTPEPTPDMDAYATSMVQTVEANYTQTAAAIPTNTPEPTYTPIVIPTETEAPVVVLPTTAPMESGLLINPAEPAPIEPTAALPMLDNAAIAAAIQEPTATPAPAAGDKASYDSQNPADGTHVEAGSEFDITWYLLNTGTTTWTTDYCMRYFTGTNLTKPGKTRYYLNEAVAPNTVGACSVDAVAPWNPGTYTMSVVLGNENDENFFIVDITIIVD